MDNTISNNLAVLSSSITDGPVGIDIPTVIDTYYDDIIVSLNTTGAILTVLLVIWVIITVALESGSRDSEIKENVSYINMKLFGTSGLINNIFGIWVVFLAAIYITYGIRFLNRAIVAANIRVNEVSEKSVLENLPIIGKLVGLINSAK